mmetsp:Transcript_69637/g.194648  ORF Transcript_69637/g.194648 Transcript_69637/m.194648 type:complete len:235 (-) Transcript_69637:451-1155(-)
MGVLLIKLSGVGQIDGQETRLCVELYAQRKGETATTCLDSAGVLDAALRQGGIAKFNIERAIVDSYTATARLETVSPSTSDNGPPVAMAVTLPVRKFDVKVFSDCAEAAVESAIGRTSFSEDDHTLTAMLKTHYPQCYEDWQRDGYHIPPVKEMLVLESGSRARFGMPAASIAFGWGDEMFLSFILERYPLFKNFFELGTGVRPLITSHQPPAASHQPPATSPQPPTTRDPRSA